MNRTSRAWGGGLLPHNSALSKHMTGLITSQFCCSLAQMASPHLMLLGFVAFHTLDGTQEHAYAKEALFQGALSPTPVDDLVLAFLFCASTGCPLLGCLSLLWEVLPESSACTVCSHGPLLFSFSRDLCDPVSHPGHWFRTGSSGS